MAHGGIGRERDGCYLLVEVVVVGVVEVMGAVVVAATTKQREQSISQHVAIVVSMCSVYQGVVVSASVWQRVAAVSKRG